MTKLRFDNLTLGQFSFKFVSKNKPPKNKKITNKLVKGICFKDGDNFKIEIDIRSLKPDIIDKGQPDILALDFTEESYNIVGVTSVFDREPDKNGKHTRYIRSESKAKYHPGSPDKYVPFCRNWICNGYIVKRDNKLMFDFNECIAPRGYDIFISDDDD